MVSQFCKSIVPLFSATLMVSLVGCGDIPNPFSSNQAHLALSASSGCQSLKQLRLEPATIHPGEKFYLRGLLQATPSATISIQIVDIVPPTASIPVVLNRRAFSVPNEGILLAEEFIAPSDLGTYSVVLQAGGASAWRYFEVTPKDQL